MKDKSNKYKSWKNISDNDQTYADIIDNTYDYIDEQPKKEKMKRSKKRSSSYKDQYDHDD